MLAGYLLGRTPGQSVRSLYRSAMERMPVLLEGKDARLMEFALKYPAFVGLIDAGTALARRDSNFRKKLVAMFAIVECSPSHSALFLPSERNRLYLAWVVWAGFRAALKALLGAIVVGLI